MVAQITEGTAFDGHGRPFRRRNYLPGILLFVALAVVTLLVWVIALSRPTAVPEAKVCNPPPAPADPNAPAPSVGERVSRADMTEVTPARLVDTKVRVLNASGQGGQAADVAGALKDLGFAEPTAANDPLYPNARLECQGQIRFGESGRAAAATVWLVAPCVELFQDSRPDNTVDLALGTDFKELASSDDIEAILASLRPDAILAPDPALVEKVHTGAC